MGRRGPPPKPTALKIIQGTFRKDRAPKREPKPKSTKGVPKPPAYLGKLAQAEWRRIAPGLHRDGLLTIADHSTFAAYCDSRANWIECSAIVREQGRTFRTETGQVKMRPETLIAQREKALMKQFAALFGLDPADRSRVEVPEKPSEDQAEAFIFGAPKKHA